MQRRNWSNILLAVSAVPSASLLAYVLWYALVFRPSGEEAWGDGVSILYLGALTYPVSLLLLVIGMLMAVRWRRLYPADIGSGPAWFVLSVVLLAAPFIALLVAAHWVGA